MREHFFPFHQLSTFALTIEAPIHWMCHLMTGSNTPFYEDTDMPLGGNMGNSIIRTVNIILTGKGSKGYKYIDMSRSESSQH